MNKSDDKLTEMLSQVSPKDIEIISSYISGSGSNKLFVELCKSSPSFWNMFIHELNKLESVSFEDAMVGAQFALGILARRSKIEALTDIFSNTASEKDSSIQPIHSK